MKLFPSVLALALFTLPGFANTYHVPGDFPDVQAAIDAAAPGDTIVIHGGTWGPLVVDKPLQLLGDPAPTIEGDGTPPSFASPLRLAGPGSGTVMLSRLHVGGVIDGTRFSFNAPGISGSGFSELHVYDSTVTGPMWFWLTGLGQGAPGIQVTLPFVLIERSTVSGSHTDTIDYVTSAPNGPPGIQVSGTVALLDSEVHGGLSGPYCYPNNACPSPCPGTLGGEGGDGVVCAELFRANSTITPGYGAEWRCDTTPFDCAQYCCDAAGGTAVVTTSEIPLAHDLWGSGPMLLGTQYTLSWSTPGPLAFLYMSLGIRAPVPYGALGHVFLEPWSLVEFGSVPSPGTVTARIPSNLALVGFDVAFQLLDPTSGLSRPVSGTWVP